MEWVLITALTGVGYGYASRKKSRKAREPVKAEEKKKNAYCETCRRPLPNRNSVEVHRAFGHDIRES